MLYEKFQSSVLYSRFPIELSSQSCGEKTIFSFELHCNEVILGKQPRLCLSFSVGDRDDAEK